MLPAAQLYAVSFPQQEWIVGVFPFVGTILLLSLASCRDRPSVPSLPSHQQIVGEFLPLQKQRSGLLSPCSRKGLRKRIPVEPRPGDASSAQIRMAPGTGLRSSSSI